MKRHWMLAFLIAGALVISTVAQDVKAQSTNTVVTQQQASSDNGEHTIVVNVWSKSEPRRTGARQNVINICGSRPERRVQDGAD